MTPLYIATPLAMHLMQWFDECVNSIEQLSKNLDLRWVIAVDGDCDEDSIREYLPTRLQRLTTILQSKGSSGAASTRATALNHIAKVAEDSWVFMLDADDCIDEAGMLEVAALLPSLSQDVGWVGTSRMYIGDIGNRPQHIVKPQAVGHYNAPDDLQWTNPCAFHPNSLLVRAACLKQIPYPTEFRYNEDAYFMFMLSAAYNGYVTDAITTVYRVWEGQSTDPSSDYTDERLPRFMKISDAINDFRADLGYGPFPHPF